MRVFISYAREDADVAVRIYNIIRIVDGLEPWMDKFNLLPGMEWELEVMRAIETSHVVLLLLSRHSVSKTGYVQKEIKESIDKAKLYPPGKIALIPIRLDDCEPSYRELRKLHRVDFMPDWNEGKRRLLSTLKKILVETDDSILTELLTHLLVRRNERRLHSREEFLKVSKSSTDFSGYNLMHLDLSRLDLSGFSFVGANLVGTKLTSSRLTGVNFRCANLERANLNYSDLGQSWIAYVNLWGTTMKRARNIRSAVIENNNIFNLKGLSDNQRARFKRAGGFETGSYDGFFSYFIKSLKLTPKRIVGDCRWLGHRYFRTLFSNEARLVLGHLSSFYHELAHVSYGPPERVILLEEPDVFYSGLLIKDMPFPIVEVVDNSFMSSYKKRKKIKK